MKENCLEIQMLSLNSILDRNEKIKQYLIYKFIILKFWLSIMYVDDISFISVMSLVIHQFEHIIFTTP